jgi:hypothetical protein
LAWL